jgi:hypothetical protein
VHALNLDLDIPRLLKNLSYVLQFVPDLCDSTRTTSSLSKEHPMFRRHKRFPIVSALATFAFFYFRKVELLKLLAAPFLFRLRNSILAQYQF